jgi:hypothetical protein
MFFTSINRYQNRESSLYLKNNTKYKNNVVVSKYVPPQKMDTSGNQSIYRTNEINGKKYKELKHPQRNPLRHYRRQLTIDNEAKTLSKQIINQFDMPGKAIVSDISSCYNCNGDNHTIFFKEEIYPNNKCIDNNLGGSGYQDVSQNIWKCISKTVNPELNVIKTSSTNVTKSYSTSNREFLKKRCKTYSQNLYSQNNNCTRDCSNNCINKNIPSNGNINNAIGGVDQSAYIYQTGYRNINNNLIDSSNTKICCGNKTVLYKDIKQSNHTCVNQLYPNFKQRKTLCF